MVQFVVVEEDVNDLVMAADSSLCSLDFDCCVFLRLATAAMNSVAGQRSLVEVISFFGSGTLGEMSWRSGEEPAITRLTW